MTINELYETLDDILDQRPFITIQFIDKVATEKERIKAIATGDLYCTQYQYRFIDIDEIKNINLIEIIRNQPIIKMYAKDNNLYFVIDGDAEVFNGWVF